MRLKHIKLLINNIYSWRDDGRDDVEILLDHTVGHLRREEPYLLGPKGQQSHG